MCSMSKGLGRWAFYYCKTNRSEHETILPISHSTRIDSVVYQIGLVIAPSAADDTSDANFARAPVS